MRALYALVVAGIALGGIGMVPAIIGRTLDWSPYALVMSGAVAGLLVGIGVTMYLYVTGTDYDELEGDAAEDPGEAYRYGVRVGRELERMGRDDA